MPIKKVLGPVPSKRFTLNKEDVTKWLTNTAIFLAPALLVFLTAIQAGMPVKQAMLAVYTYLLNVVIDLLKKYVSGK